jgi:hypothetical protein
VVDTPLPNAIAAHRAILRIGHELLFSALATAPLLTGPIGTHGLLGLKSGWLELFLAETATVLIHPFKVTVFCMELPRRRSSKSCQPAIALRNLTWGKKTD